MLLRRWEAVRGPRRRRDLAAGEGPGGPGLGDSHRPGVGWCHRPGPPASGDGRSGAGVRRPGRIGRWPGRRACATCRGPGRPVRQPQQAAGQAPTAHHVERPVVPAAHQTRAHRDVQQRDDRQQHSAAPLQVGQEKKGCTAVADGGGGRVARGIETGLARQRTGRSRPVEERLERDDEGGDRGHGERGGQRRQPPTGHAPAPPEPGCVTDRGHQYGQRHHCVAQIGKEPGGGGREGGRTGNGTVQPPVELAQRTTRGHLPRTQPQQCGETAQSEEPERHGRKTERSGSEDDRATSEHHGRTGSSRRPRNRGGGSGAAAGIGVPHAPGGLGRAAIRSVRRSGARGSSGVPDGTAAPMLGKHRLGVARSSLRAGYFSHLQKRYGSYAPCDRWITHPSSASHIFFTMLGSAFTPLPAPLGVQAGSLMPAPVGVPADPMRTPAGRNGASRVGRVGTGCHGRRRAQGQ
jgi:hypothetical protein